MAVYHLSVKPISRGSGRSAVAAAAYRSGERLTNERDGQTHDYSRRHGVEHTEVMTPDNAPDWMQDRGKLWNAVETVEKRKDARLSREVEIALPRELTPGQRVELVREFVRSEFVGRGMVADVAIHCPTASDGREQPHAHIMLTTREIVPQGFGAKVRDWDRTDALEGWRERWAEHQNQALERAGLGERVDHRTLEAQRAAALGIANDNTRTEPERAIASKRAAELDREPQPKIGVAAAGMERRGIGTERGWEVRLVVERNGLRRQLRSVVVQLVEVEREGEAAKRRALAERIKANLSGQEEQTARPAAPDLTAKVAEKARQAQPQQPDQFPPVTSAERGLVAAWERQIDDRGREIERQREEKYDKALEPFREAITDIEKHAKTRPELKSGLLAFLTGAEKRSEEALEAWEAEEKRLYAARDAAGSEASKYQGDQRSSRRKAEEELTAAEPEQHQQISEIKGRIERHERAERDAGYVVREFWEQALGRECKARGWDDTGRHWLALPEQRRMAITDYNAKPEAERTAIREAMQKHLAERFYQKPEAAEEMKRQLERSGGRGR